MFLETGPPLRGARECPVSAIATRKLVRPSSGEGNGASAESCERSAVPAARLHSLSWTEAADWLCG